MVVSLRFEPVIFSKLIKLVTTKPILVAWSSGYIVGYDVQAFKLFIFLSCSREFTHRVKSVSMAMFTSQEVDALQNGGNQVQWWIIFSIFGILEPPLFPCWKEVSMWFFNFSVQGKYIWKIGTSKGSGCQIAGLIYLIFC